MLLSNMSLHVKALPFLLALSLATDSAFGGVEISGFAKMRDSIIIFCSIEGEPYIFNEKGQSAGGYTLVDLDIQNDLVYLRKDEVTYPFKLRAGSVSAGTPTPASPAAKPPFKTNKVIITKQVATIPKLSKALSTFLQNLETGHAIPPDEREALKRLLSDPEAKIVILGSEGLSQADSTEVLPLTDKMIKTANEAQRMGEALFQHR